MEAFLAMGSARHLRQFAWRFSPPTAQRRSEPLALVNGRGHRYIVAPAGPAGSHSREPYDRHRCDTCGRALCAASCAYSPRSLRYCPTYSSGCSSS